MPGARAGQLSGELSSPRPVQSTLTTARQRARTVSRRQARDATLNVLSLFDGGEKDRSRINFNQGNRRDRTLGPELLEPSGDNSLVDDYLEKNSLVDCSSATIPLLKRREKKKNRKNKKNTSRKERLERSKHS